MVKTGFVAHRRGDHHDGAHRVPDVIRAVVKDIGYTSSDMGFDGNDLRHPHGRRAAEPDIAQGVNEGEGSTRSRAPATRA
jgi:S-adenosylmethionine synthetase